MRAASEPPEASLSGSAAQNSSSAANSPEVKSQLELSQSTKRESSWPQSSEKSACPAMSGPSSVQPSGRSSASVRSVSSSGVRPSREVGPAQVLSTKAPDAVYISPASAYGRTSAPESSASAAMYGARSTRKPPSAREAVSRPPVYRMSGALPVRMSAFSRSASARLSAPVE